MDIPITMCFMESQVRYSVMTAFWETEDGSSVLRIPLNWLTLDWCHALVRWEGEQHPVVLLGYRCTSGGYRWYGRLGEDGCENSDDSESSAWGDDSDSEFDHLYHPEDEPSPEYPHGVVIPFLGWEELREMAESFLEKLGDLTIAKTDPIRGIQLDLGRNIHPILDLRYCVLLNTNRDVDQTALLLYDCDSEDGVLPLPCSVGDLTVCGECYTPDLPPDTRVTRSLRLEPFYHWEMEEWAEKVRRTETPTVILPPCDGESERELGLLLPECSFEDRR